MPYSPQLYSFHIGNVIIHNPLVLAPMAGITDTVFRRIIKNMGAGLVYSEMLSCQAIHYACKKTFKMLEFSPDELPIAMQIFGSDPKLMAEAAKKVEDAGASIVDVNLGCSVPKVAKSGAGAALCRNLPLLASVLESTVKAVSIPVTIKIRIGWNQQEKSAPEVCRIARECGVAAVAIHGRTSSQKFSGTADWQYIRKLRKEVDLPMIGNGDIKEPAQVWEMMKFSGCDGIMIGREAYYNPWIFRDALNYIKESGVEKKQNERPEDRRDDEGFKVQNESVGSGKSHIFEIRDLILYQLEEMVARYGEFSGVQKMRKFVAWYTRGLPNSARFREKAFKMESVEAMKDAILNYFSVFSKT